MYGKNGSNYSQFLNKEFDEITYQDYISAPHRYLRTQDFARMLFYKEIYEKIIDIQGEIHLLGVANGSTLFILAHLAEILEPLNTTRRIVGFDLFGSLDEAYYPITSEDNEYYENYLKAKKAGVNFLAYRCKISSKEIFIDKKIKIINE